MRGGKGEGGGRWRRGSRAADGGLRGGDVRVLPERPAIRKQGSEHERHGHRAGLAVGSPVLKRPPRPLRLDHVPPVHPSIRPSKASSTHAPPRRTTTEPQAPRPRHPPPTASRSRRRLRHHPPAYPRAASPPPARPAARAARPACRPGGRPRAPAGRPGRAAGRRARSGPSGCASRCAGN